MKNWWWILLVVVIAGLITNGVWRATHPSGVSVNMVKVSKGEFVREITGTGNVEAKEFSLSFARPGRVERILVAEGDSVRAEQLLAELGTDKEREDLQAARQDLAARAASLRAAEAKSAQRLSTIRADLRKAERDRDLGKRLLEAGAQSAQEVRDLERKVSDLREDYRVALADAAGTRGDLLSQRAMRVAEIQGYERVLREARLTAPVAGVVSKIDFRVGETVSGTIKMVEAGSLRVKAQISESDATEIKVGQAAKIELDAVLNHPLEARVSELGVVAASKGEGTSATLPVYLRFSGGDFQRYARPGYTLTARVTVVRRSQAVQVSLDALADDEKERPNMAALWVIDPVTSTIAKREVTVKMRNLTNAVIEGLKPDTMVVSIPSATLRDGMRVRYDKPAEKGKS